jgi:hypothetical protein
VGRHHWPRRPDFADVACGFTARVGAWAGAAGFASGFSVGGTAFRFVEKSGIDRGLFFFMAPS